MSDIKSPFLIIRDFISPKVCEHIIGETFIAVPNKDVNGTPQKLERHNTELEQDIAIRVHEIVPDIERTFDAKYTGLQQPLFQYYPENPKGPAEPPGCENSKFVRRKWVMYKDVDLVGYVWLKDSNEKVPHDPRFEVFGGKLEFPQFNFSLIPQRGTLVLFPAGPHFITCISPVLLGDLYQIKLNINVTQNGARFLYNPSKFPGSWQEWLNEHI